MSGPMARLRTLVGRWRMQAQLAWEFRAYLRPHRAKLILAVFLSIVFAGLRLLEPWPLQILFDQVVMDKRSHFSWFDPLALAGGDKQALTLAVSAALLLVAALSGTIYYIQSILLAGVGQGIVRSIREDVFHQMQRLSLSFHRRSSTGDLLMRLTGDMILLRDMIVASLVTLTSHVVVFVSALVLMATVSLRLTIVAVILSPVLYLLFSWFRKRMVAAARLQRRREGTLATSLEEVLLSMPMIQAYTAERKEDERFRKICKKSERAGLRGARLEAGMQRIVELLMAIGTALVLWAGIREILRNALTPGLFLVFTAYLRGLYRPVRGLSKVAERTARATAATERVLEILRARREVKDAKDAVEAPAFRGEIRFEQVTFSYESGTRALDAVDFRIHAGEQVALVGPTGAGKSTLFSLLLRFQDPAEGRVLIDGVPLRKCTLRSLRGQIAYLPQDPFVLGVSVRENLLYGNPDASDDELWDALRSVGMDEVVTALGGLDTMIQSRGQSLSGGQKQRLAIARALLKDAPILLLDEPTTGLDACSERDVLEALDRLRRGRTTITVAHRISTIRSARRVMVLEAGRLIENGPPEELLARDSLFRLFASLQGISTAPDLGAPDPDLGGVPGRPGIHAGGSL